LTNFYIQKAIRDKVLVGDGYYIEQNYMPKKMRAEQLASYKEKYIKGHITNVEIVEETGVPYDTVNFVSAKWMTGRNKSINSIPRNYEIKDNPEFLDAVDMIIEPVLINNKLVLTLPSRLNFE
jgi:hypothetical protein